MTTTSSSTPRHPSQWLSGIIGAIYLVFGIAGLVSIASVPFAGPDGIQVAGFRVNGAQGIVALLIAAGGLLAFTRLALAARYGWALVVVSFGLALYGTLVDQSSSANVLAFDQSDVGRHVITGVIALLIALWPATNPATAGAEPGSRR
jgi:hypothetical protein